jgi:hypothetical protein
VVDLTPEQSSVLASLLAGEPVPGRGLLGRAAAGAGEECGGGEAGDGVGGGLNVPEDDDHGG